MSLTLQQFRDELREHCGVDSVEWDNTATDKLINFSFWEICDLFEFREKEGTAILSAVNGTNDYLSPTDVDSIESITVLDNNSDEWDPVTFLGDKEFEGLLSDRVDSRTKPTHYKIRNNEIVLYPTPETAYSLRVQYKRSLGDVLSSGTRLPQNWDEPILFGAIWRGFARLGDWNRKQSAKAAQAELIQPKKSREVKELEDTQMAGLQVPRRAYR